MAKNESANSEEKERRQEDSIHTELSPGAQLSARRQSLNWSIEQVAGQLNLAPRQIQAIESDNYAALPGMATARGFVRSYAKLLNVDAAPLLQIIAKEATASEDAVPLRRALPAVRFAESRLSPSPGKNRLLSRLASITLLLCVLIGGLFFTQQLGMHSILPAFMHAGTGDSPVILTPLGAVDTVEKSSDADGGTEQYRIGLASASTESDNAAARDNGAMNQVDGSSVTLAPRPMSVENTAVASAPAVNGGAKDMLTLKLREDSWVEIKRSDNSTVVSALLKAGNTESFKITGPVAMTIGNASAVEATLRGKPVELKPDAKTNVARLNLK